MPETCSPLSGCGLDQWLRLRSHIASDPHPGYPSAYVMAHHRTKSRPPSSTAPPGKKATQNSTKKAVKKTVKKATNEEVNAAIENIRKFYDVGRSSREKFNRRMEFNETEANATELGVNVESLKKARAFAREYSPVKFDQLIALIRKYGFLDRHPVGSQYVIRLLAVPKEDRADFQHKAISKRWILTRLIAEIRLQFPPRNDPGPGHKPNPASSPDEACFMLLRQCQRWLRLCEALQSATGQSALPRSVRQRIGPVKSCLENFEKELLRRFPKKKEKEEKKK
jgi:hypothetical protein